VIGAYLAGAEVDGERPAVAQVLAPTILMGVMAYGMWRARYWAVLGFGVVLVFLIIGSALGLVQAANGLQVLGRSVILIGAGTLFFFMIKAMARIQMPERPGAR
jgi:glucose uptake protein GlcU